MAKIPDYFAQEPMETGRMPRAPMGIADTGQGLKAQSLIGFGGALGKIGQLLAGIESERQRARDNVTLAEMKGMLDDFEFESTPDLAQIEKIEDFNKLEEKYGKDWKKKVGELSKGKNKRIADQFKIYSELHWDTARKGYHNRSWPLEQDYAVASFNREWSKRFKSHIDNPEKLKSELQALIEQYEPYLKPTYKQKLEASIDEEIAIYQKQNTLNKLHNAAKTMPYKEAIGFLNDIEGLTSAERNDLIRRRERQEEIATSTTNRQVRWDTLLEIAKDPASVTDEYLNGLVKPNSLTWDDAEELRNIRDKDNHPLKRTDFQRGLTTLEEIKDMQITIMKADDATAEELRDELLLHFRFKNDLEQWMTEKDRTTEEIEKKVKSLTTGVVEEMVHEFWDISNIFWKERLLLAAIPKIGRKKAKPEVVSPYPEYPDAFLEDNVWKVIRDGKKYRIE